MAAPCVFASERLQRADVVLRRILTEILTAVRQHVDAVLIDDDIEALHDFRVAVRRSRVAAALLATTLPKNDIATYRKDLKWLGEITGECRDLDVVLSDFVEEGDERVRLMLVEDRLLAHRGVVEALRSQRFDKWARDWETYLRESPEPPHALPADRLLPTPVRSGGRSPVRSLLRPAAVIRRRNNAPARPVLR